MTGTSNTIINNPPPVSKFVVSAPATATAGVAFPVTVTAEDLFGDTVTGFNGARDADRQRRPAGEPGVTARFWRRHGRGNGQSDHRRHIRPSLPPGGLARARAER